MVEQNLPTALGVADYVYAISKGVIVYQSTPEESRDNKETKAKYPGEVAQAIYHNFIKSNQCQDWTEERSDYYEI